jgi:hypothetical protein
MVSKYVVEGREFAKICHTILRSDREIVAGCAGMTGEGKSCFLDYLFHEYARVSGTFYNRERMTWSRKELETWVNGEGPTCKGQLPEYSAVNVDELFLLFYKRTWWHDDQINSVGMLNMCRDRHLFIAGNVPNLWDLDSAFLARIRFFFWIPERGKAWVFQPESNPFAKDVWNVSNNSQIFRKLKNPYLVPNFVCEIHYPDWTPEEKAAYYDVRNRKRVMAQTEAKGAQHERYSFLKEQRDRSIKFGFTRDAKLTNDLAGRRWLKARGLKPLILNDYAQVTGLSIKEIERAKLKEYKEL